MSDISCILLIEGVTTWDSIKYLGALIFKSKPKKSDWSPLIEKVKKIIWACGATWLNLAGKLILIKSILKTFPLYQYAIMVAPIGILSII